MKIEQWILKLILCFLALLMIVLFFSYIAPQKIKASNLEDANILLAVFVGPNILIRLTPSFVAVGYAFTLFHILMDNPKRQLIMILNAVIMMILSLGTAMFIFFYTSYFTTPSITIFTRTMITIGLLNIILSFTFKIFRHS